MLLLVPELRNMGMVEIKARTRNERHAGLWAARWCDCEFVRQETTREVFEFFYASRLVVRLVIRKMNWNGFTS